MLRRPTTGRTGRSGERGLMLVATAVTLAGLLSFAGLSVDLGRMYVAKSEAQAYTDSAAVAAALQLDATSIGIANAIAVVAGNTMKWSFGTRSFSQVTVEFAPVAAGPWAAQPALPAGYMYARVRATADVDLYLLSLLTARRTVAVAASSVAAQVPKLRFSQGLFPFSPFQHNTVPPDFGLIPGQNYTLRWASNPKLGTGNVCAGDQVASVIALAQAQGGSERGFIEQASASLIRATIEDDYQSVVRSIGDVVDMTGGAKQTELDSLHNRIMQDSDVTSGGFAAYLADGRGNGRRIVAVPINDGGSPSGTNNRIVQVAAFFLHATGAYGHGGNQPWCAEYVGAWVEGAGHPGAGAAGAYVVRLVE